MEIGRAVPAALKPFTPAPAERGAIPTQSRDES